MPMPAAATATAARTMSKRRGLELSVMGDGFPLQ
jgi:hypothetical protein